MFILNIEFTNNFHTDMMLECQDIPCLCKINDKFQIEFFETIPHVTGIVSGWSWEGLNQRVPAGSGGEYLYYKHSLISLEKVDHTNFVIKKLSMFINGVGWCAVIEDSQYAQPNLDLWDIDPDD